MRPLCAGPCSGQSCGRADVFETRSAYRRYLSSGGLPQSSRTTCRHRRRSCAPVQGVFVHKLRLPARLELPHGLENHLIRAKISVPGLCLPSRSKSRAPYSAPILLHSAQMAACLLCAAAAAAEAEVSESGLWMPMARGAGGAPAAASVGYDDHKPRTPPPDLPSLLLDSRITYLGMPVSAHFLLC